MREIVCKSTPVATVSIDTSILMDSSYTSAAPPSKEDTRKADSVQAISFDLTPKTDAQSSSDRSFQARQIQAGTAVKTDTFDLSIGEFGTSGLSAKGIVLPPLNQETFVSQRHEVNPALALNLLSEIQSMVVAWQTQLRQILQSMHSLYAQGPMVDGWLESSMSAATERDEDTASVVAHSTAQSAAHGPEATILRHGDANTLMQYVDALAADALEDDALKTDPENEAIASSIDKATAQSVRYRLCSLADDGTVRSQPCPPEQMASVSRAITRYQKFKQLEDQKRAVEAKLQQAVDQLTGVRAGLQ